MPAFKPKATKKIICSTKTNVTVDNKHQEMMNNFSDIENNLIPKLEKEKEEIKKMIKIENSIEEKLELKDKLKEIKKESVKKRRRKKNIYYKMLNMYLIILKKRKI